MSEENIKNKTKFPEIVKMFSSLTRTKGAWEVWNDVITMWSISISNTLDIGERKEKREKEFLNIKKKYSDIEIDTIIKMFADITNELEENPEQDLLGNLYLSRELGSNALGQFFTPYHICQTMADITLIKSYIETQINENGFITMNEPACGAGANIIAAANAIKKQGFNYQLHLYVLAQDLSKVTALMCYIQMSLLGIAGAVYIGDTLRNGSETSQTFLELSEDVWLTPMYHTRTWKIRRMKKLLKEK